MRDDDITYPFTNFIGRAAQFWKSWAISTATRKPLPDPLHSSNGERVFVFLSEIK